MNLKQLSEELGLSQTTVSRALNGYPEVSESTRERVQRAADASQYRPNLRAMSLATGKAMAIGHVIPVFSKNDVVNPIFAEFVAGASQTYKEHGYELMLTVADETDEEKIYRSLAAKRAVDGFFVHSPLCSEPRVELLNDIGLPFVVHGRVTNASLPYSWIDMNNQRAFAQATDLLLDLGHTRIGLLNGPQTLNFASLRRQGYENALRLRDIDVDPTLIHESELTESFGFEATQNLLSSTHPPTAIVASSYVVALGVRRAVSLAGLQIKKDISVIIHDDVLSYFDNSGGVPQFTATRSSVREAGVKGAHMLLDIIDSTDRSPLTHMLEAQLVIGASTGPINPG